MAGGVPVGQRDQRQVEHVAVDEGRQVSLHGQAAVALADPAPERRVHGSTKRGDQYRAGSSHHTRAGRETVGTHTQATEGGGKLGGDCKGGGATTSG